MHVFKISGLQVVEDALIEVQYELYDPSQEAVSPSRVGVPDNFIVCSRGMFYHYQRTHMPAQWVRAQLDVQIDAAPLQFSVVLFRKEHSIVLGLGVPEVGAFMESDQLPTEEEIREKLVAEKHQYQTINQKKTIDDFLSTVGIEKPENPNPLEWSAERWEEAWQKGLVFVLTTHMQNFEEKLPVDTPQEIKEMLPYVYLHLNPVNIDKYRFYESSSAWPSIGAVYDHLVYSLSQRISEELRPDSNSIMKLSPIFYEIKVGCLFENQKLVYTGLSEEQYYVLMLLCDDFVAYDISTEQHDHILVFKSCSIQWLEYITHLLSENVTADTDEQIMSDFYALASALSASENISEFDASYRQYKIQAHASLQDRIERLRKNKAELLENIEDIERINSMLNKDNEAAIVFSMENEKLGVLCKLPGFLTVPRLVLVLKVIFQSELDESIQDFTEMLCVDNIKAIIKDDIELILVLNVIPSAFLKPFLEMLGVDNIKKMIKNYVVLVLFLRALPPASCQLFLKIMGVDCIKAMIQCGYKLGGALSMFPEGFRMAFLKMLGVDTIKVIIQNGHQLASILEQLAQEPRLAFLEMLGVDNIKAMIQNRHQLGHILDKLPEGSKLTFLGMLGVDIIKAMIQNGYQLSSILEKLPAGSKLTFLEMLGVDNIKAMIQDSYQLGHILDKLPEGSKLTFLKMLGVEPNKSTAQGEKQLDIVLNELPMDPIFYPKAKITTVSNKRSLRHILFPGGMSAGLVCGLGVGLALAFSPVSMIGPLHMTLGAIIGIAAVTSLVTMAMYVVLKSYYKKDNINGPGHFFSWRATTSFSPEPVLMQRQWQASSHPKTKIHV